MKKQQKMEKNTNFNGKMEKKRKLCWDRLSLLYKEGMDKYIDYSCGAGHFLTEAMDRIQNYIDTIDKTKQGNKIKSQLNIWQKDEDGVILK